MFNVVITDEWCSTVPESWIDKNNNTVLWPPDNLDISKAIRKLKDPQDSWNVIKFKYILGPYGKNNNISK